MSVTRDTSHFDKSWLKDVALANVMRIFVTPDTSHCDKSWSNNVALKNNFSMLVMRDTSHSPIGPRRPEEQSPVGETRRSSSTALLSPVNAKRDSIKDFCEHAPLAQVKYSTDNVAKMYWDREAAILLDNLANNTNSCTRACDSHGALNFIGVSAYLMSCYE